MIKTTLLSLVAVAALLPAQTPAPPPIPAPATAPAPGHITHKILFASLAGAASGVAIGTEGLNFAGVPDRRAHEFRAGLTYGVIGGVLGGAIAASLTPAPQTQDRFWWSRGTTPLWAGIAAVQVLDYTSTRYFRDRDKDEWLLTDRLVDDKPAFVATEISAASAAIGLAYLFHYTGHPRLERVFAAGYITFGVTSAIANYRYPTTGHALF